MRQHWGLGMRTLKTALAIWLAFWAADLLQFQNGALAAITTIVAVQPSLRGSVSTVKNQLIATTFGCGLAIVVAYYFHGSYTAVALSTIVAIAMCVRLNLKESVVLLLVTMIIISQTPLENFQTAVVERVVSVVIGLTIGFLLNYLFKPQYNHRLQEQMDALRQEFEQLYRDCAEDLRRAQYMEKELMQKRIMDLRDHIQDIRNTYKLSVDSRMEYDEKNTRDELYLMRRTINALASNLERLIEIHRSITLAPQLDDGQATRQMVYQYLMEVLYNHQRIFEYLLFDKPFTREMMQAFSCRDGQMQQQMVTMVKEMDGLLPLHYWNITVEAERIMYKTWNLTRIKHQIQGLELEVEELREPYRLQ